MECTAIWAVQFVLINFFKKENSMHFKFPINYYKSLFCLNGNATLEVVRICKNLSSLMGHIG